MVSFASSAATSHRNLLLEADNEIPNAPLRDRLGSVLPTCNCWHSSRYFRTAVFGRSSRFKAEAFFPFLLAHPPFVTEKTGSSVRFSLPFGDFPRRNIPLETANPSVGQGNQPDSQAIQRLHGAIAQSVRAANS